MRRRDHDARRVRVLLRLRIVDETEANGIRESLDRDRIARQKVPSIRGSRSTVVLEILSLLAGSERRCFFMIDAYGDHFVFRACIVLERTHRTDQAVEHLRAEHRTLVVRERKYHGAPAEVSC